MKLKNLFFYIFILTVYAQCESNSEEDPQPEDAFVVNDFNAFVNEGVMQGQTIGIIDATTSEGSLTFTLTTQSPDGAIEVNDATGVITVANPDLFVFAANPQITAVVEVTNGIGIMDANLLISVNDPSGPTLTVWTGPKLTFTKGNEADPNNASNQDRLTDNVWITRGNNGGPIYNAVTESSSDTGPAGTEWALGNIEDVETLNFSNLQSAAGGGRGAFKSLPGKTFVLHLIQDDIYLEVSFLSWSQGKLGGFSYERATP